MKYLFYFLVVIMISLRGSGQHTGIDSLIQLIKITKTDTNRVNLLLKLADKIYFFQPLVSLKYSTEALAISRDLKYKKGIVSALSLAGEALRVTGDYPAALKMQFEALEMNQELKDIHGEASNLGFIGISFMELKEYRQALYYLLEAADNWQKIPNTPPAIFTFTNIGRAYDFLGMPDSAMHYLQIAGERNKEMRHPQLASNIPLSIGNVYAGMARTDSVLHYYRLALQNSRLSNESINMSRIQLKIAEFYKSHNNPDSGLFYARGAYSDALRTGQKLMLMESGSLLSQIYRMIGKPDSAFIYEDITDAMKDSLYGIGKFQKLQLLMLEEQKREQQNLKEQEQFKTRLKIVLLLSASGVLLLLSFLLLYNNRQKQKAKARIENAYTELKSTQTQLIQTAKMASLGELTAGIAHEIQNPLNFVNNFSELSGEMILEAEGGRQQAGENSPLVSELLTDIKKNLEKINLHGKRADAIVKNMMQHSRTGSGEKSPTNLNALADEYLRLAYHSSLSGSHGGSGGENNLNITIPIAIAKDFDPSVGGVNLIPQDIGRVLLNLYNNAFYAVKEKEKEEEKYEPQISVSTKRNGNEVRITVRDNGSGIPEQIIHKIFQPFFTTKPPGQGTGLGLSLAYDIIKAHGGEISVNSIAGKGSEFTIMLPS